MERKDVDISKIKSARKTIKPFIKKTTLKYSQFFSSLCQGEVDLKLENTQVSNAFKIRGAFNKMLHLTSKEKQRGVITPSSGNHGLAVAMAAKELNLSAKIIVPETTPRKKIDKIKKYNVELMIYGKEWDEAEQKALDLARKEGITYVSSYNDPLVIAGQGTIGLEILEELPEVEAVLVPIGGGSLISGIATVIKDRNRDIKVIGVQSKASPVMYESLKAGEIVKMRIEDSIADGLSGGIEEGSITFKIIQKNVDEVILVKEESIKGAIRLLWEKDNQVVEGAGAVGPAALTENRTQFKNKKIVAVISGGNIDDDIFNEITRVST
ncbi:MAG: threonine/serine dehydratase [Candidatus Aerophobetes bacterium]|nr:threonine/serine dehydratase [Candidatus Aerophobetes bacterium]